MLMSLYVLHKIWNFNERVKCIVVMIDIVIGIMILRCKL